MKRGKILVVGLIGLLMAGGLILAGCDEGCDRGGGCYAQVDSDGYVSRSSCGSSKCQASGGNSPRPGSPLECNCK